MLHRLALHPRLRSLRHVAERTRRIGSLLAYVVVSLLGLGAGFGAVQLLASPEDEVPASSATSTTTTTTTTEPTIEGVGIALSDVESVADALALIDRAPAAPEPGVSVTVAEGSNVQPIAGSTAFVVDSAELDELGPPFLPDSDGKAVTLTPSDKVVVMVALSEPFTEPDGLVASVVYETPGEPAKAIGPFTGTTSAVAARITRNDVIGSVASADGSFVPSSPAGSLRIDGPLLTFVVEPVAPFRVVIARGFDDSLDNFGFNPVAPGPALSPADLTRLDVADALVSALTTN